MRLDLTLNIPSISSLLASFISLVGGGVGLYNGLENRQTLSEFEIGTLAKRVENNETAVSNLREEQGKREAQLRAEMKGDVAEIKDILYRVYYGPSQGRQPAQQQLNEWRK